MLSQDSLHLQVPRHSLQYATQSYLCTFRKQLYWAAAQSWNYFKDFKPKRTSSLSLSHPLSSYGNKSTVWRQETQSWNLWGLDVASLLQMGLAMSRVDTNLCEPLLAWDPTVNIFSSIHTTLVNTCVEEMYGGDVMQFLSGSGQNQVSIMFKCYM